MGTRFAFVVLVSAGLAAAASATDPLSTEGPLVSGESGLEIRDTGLLVRDTELDVAALYQSCREMSDLNPSKRRLRKLVRRGLLVTADQIPVAHTPGCGYDEFPEPVLETCNEPLPPGIPDLRGLWVVYEGLFTGHVERIEQCGNRVVITGGGVVHDMRADGVLDHGVDDVSAIDCSPIRVAAEFVDGSLQLRPSGSSLVAVTRKLEGEDLLWDFLFVPNRMLRICEVAPSSQIPSSRRIPLTPRPALPVSTRTSR
jgi:hypothetical protein